MNYNILFQKGILPIAEITSKTTIQKKLKFLIKSQYWSRKKIEEYQNKKLKELIINAYSNTTYYKELLDTLNITPSDIQTKKDLKKLPILTKEIIKKNYEELRANNIRNTIVKYTSGSTGTPMKFYLTKEDYSWVWGTEFRNWSRAGYQLGDKYIKFSLNNDRGKISKQLQDKLIKCFYIYALNMNEKTMGKYYRLIKKIKPKYIYGYSSALNVFSEYLEKNNLSYNAKAVFTTGDNLIPTYRKRIEKIFECKVFDLYGCGGEGLNIAAQCKYGKYHINDEVLIVENINGEAVITSLNNYAMPLIRYKIGDMITLDKSKNKCKCGSALSIIKKIDGRSKDVIYLENGTIVVHFFTVLFEHIKNVNQFKIIQCKKNEIIIQIIKNPEYNIKDEKKISNKIRTASKNTKIIFQYVKKIPFEKNGKRRLIENRLQ